MTPELENALLAQRHELEDPAEPPLAVAAPEIDYADQEPEASER